ncbi:MAG: A24 family peptidase, partial [Alphaproteobacteria bacterium]|nr:A24 family peptidase [Alphaproteobacteria bacterium]
YKKFIRHSLICGILSALLIFGVQHHFSSATALPLTIYCLILILLAEIDFRSRFLPDILTIPLLILGFLFSCLNFGLVNYYDSAFGAFLGYFVPVAATLLIAWYKKDAFGGGDIKLLSAIGAWLGVSGLVFVIVFSSIIGLIYALIRKQRELAFGPMIALSGIIIAFFLF